MIVGNEANRKRSNDEKESRRMRQVQRRTISNNIKERKTRRILGRMETVIVAGLSEETRKGMRGSIRQRENGAI